MEWYQYENGNYYHREWDVQADINPRRLLWGLYFRGKIVGNFDSPQEAKAEAEKREAKTLARKKKKEG